MRRERGAFSFAEVIVALALFALAGLGLMTAMNGGAQVGARASEMRMATILGARVVDRLVATGYDRLHRQIAKGRSEGDLKLYQLAGRGAARAARRGRKFGLIADGFEYTGRFKLEDTSPGLIKLRITLIWQRYGLKTPEAPGQMELLRYVVDPTLAMAARESFSGEVASK
jgi:hypothetical protein